MIYPVRIDNNDQLEAAQRQLFGKGFKWKNETQEIVRLNRLVAFPVLLLCDFNGKKMTWEQLHTYHDSMDNILTLISLWEGKS